MNRHLHICISAVLIPLFLLLFSAGAAAHYSMMHGGYQHEYTQNQFEGPITAAQAGQILEDYLEMGGNPNLKPGEIQEKQDHFLGEVLTRDGSLVNRIRIDKASGSIRSRHGLGSIGRDQGEDQRWHFCPYCGKGLHPGQKRHSSGSRRHMEGHGRMGHGYGYDAGPDWKDNEAMGADKAKNIVGKYLSAIKNPNLETGAVEEKSQVFEVEIVTKKSGDLVDVVRVDKYTGRMQSVY